MNKMNNVIVYKKRTVVSKPYSDYLSVIVSNACQVVMALVDRYNGFTSAIHLGHHQIIGYHTDDFHPHEAVVGKIHLPLKSIEVSKCKKDLYHTYEVPVAPHGGILQVATKIKNEDFVYQIGVRRNETEVISFGTVEPSGRHLDCLDHSCIQTGSESGSALFTSEGKLLGMTLGHVSPEVMLATPITELLCLEESFFSEEFNKLIGQN